MSRVDGPKLQLARRRPTPVFFLAGEHRREQKRLAPFTDKRHNALVPLRHLLSRAQAFIFLLIVSAAAAVEWLSGRPPICKCGRVALWTGAVNGPENSQMVADWYSLSHIVHGLLLYGFLWLVARRWPPGWRLVVATFAEAVWELLENSPLVIERYRAGTIALGYSGDSIINSMSDVGFMMLGFTLASVLAPRATVALGVCLELVSLIAIRDNLVLNVLMLVHPFDAIRVWQGSQQGVL